MRYCQSKRGLFRILTVGRGRVRELLHDRPYLFQVLGVPGEECPTPLVMVNLYLVCEVVDAPEELADITSGELRLVLVHFLYTIISE